MAALAASMLGAMLGRQGADLSAAMSLADKTREEFDAGLLEEPRALTEHEIRIAHLRRQIGA